MGVSVSSGNTSITGTATTVIQKQTVLFATATRTTVGTTTILTTTVGKTTRIIGMNLKVSGQGGSNTVAAITIDGATALQAVSNTSATGCCVDEASFKGSYSDAIVVAASKVIAITESGATGQEFAEIYYVEE